MLDGMRGARLFLAGFLVVAQGVPAVDRAPAFEMNRRLGRGVNLGNTFEAWPNEDSWGNPWKPEYLGIIRDLGFQHVRVPVNWDLESRAMMEKPYTLQPEFLARIKGVVEAALDRQLLVILNMHHHGKVHRDPEASRERFLSQWAQIAEFFKDEPDRLLFEVMNEPQGKLRGETWARFFADALKEIRRSNPRRVVLMGDGGSDTVPDDPCLIYTPHFYEPHGFTHQNASWEPKNKASLGAEWLNTAPERSLVERAADRFAAFGKKHDLPVHVGEFGVIRDADMASRARWSNFAARCFEERKFSWAYWDFSAVFGIYDRKSGKLDAEMVDALLHRPMPPPAAAEPRSLYESDFSAGADGWRLSVAGGAQASMAAEHGALVVAVANPGSAGWHVQLARRGFSLGRARLYAIRYAARDAKGRRVTSYMGSPRGPWSGFCQGEISARGEEAAYCFFMARGSDPACGLTLDLGGGEPSTFVLEGVKVQEIVVQGRTLP
jgi:hypothetical protein